jgi:hypothetical protein
MDTLDAMAWQRGDFDVARIVAMWEHQFDSRFDPVIGESPRKPQ